MAQRLKLTIKDRSRKMKRQMIVSKLIAQGYSGEIARKAVDQIDLDEEEENGALEKMIAKAMRLYASKYNGGRLQQKIMEYGVRKGFGLDAIRQKLQEQEWNDDE